MNPRSTTSNTQTKISGRAQSARLLIFHVVFCLAAVGFAFVFRALNLHFYPCMFYQITGHACLSCGATRAVLALLRFDIVGSFLSNPLPLLLAAWMLVILGFEIAGVIQDRRIPYRWLAQTIVFIVAVLFIYALLRFFSLAPMPV